MEVARLFNQLPIALKAIPLTEYRKMVRYYRKLREAEEDASGSINVDRLLARGGRLDVDNDG